MFHHNVNAIEVNKKEITVSDFADLLKAQTNVVIIDVRRKEEYDIVNIPNAVLIPLDKLTKLFAELGQGNELNDDDLEHYKTFFEQLKANDKQIIIHCHSGRRSLLAVDVLEKAQISAKSLKGGIVGYQEAGLKVKKAEEVVKNHCTP